MTTAGLDRSTVERLLGEAAASPQARVDPELEGIGLAILLEESLQIVVSDAQIRALPGLDAEGVIALLAADTGGD